jgi:GAF domain-containing protein
MPYLTCPQCRTPTYVVSAGDCPSCGTALRPRAPAGPRPQPDPADFTAESLRAKLAMARRELDADAALLSEIVGGRERVRWAVGGYQGVSARLEDSICRRLLDGSIGPLVTDTQAEPVLAGLPSVRDGSIAAYLGVPIRTADARLYVLCCLARERRPDLGPGDVRFLQGVAESLRALLEPST